jgi:hypothetical protein
MTDKEAMAIALDALGANQPINYCMNNNGEKFPMFSNDPLRQERNEKAIAALKERLAQPEQERNFCSRCGKRTPDLTHIHTCTPPPREGT